MIRPIIYNYIRVSKPKARTLYEKGLEVHIVPCNFSPDNYYMPASPIPKDLDFDKFIRDYSIYNCVNRETGKYPAFYVRDTGGKIDEYI
jgi:hypothetical protein